MEAATHNVIWDGGNAHFISWIRGFAYNNSNPLFKIYSVMKLRLWPPYDIIGNGDDIHFISWVRGIAYNNSNPQPTIHSQLLFLLNLVQGWKYK